MYNRRPADMVGVAQSVERRIVIPVVVGSNPIVHPIFEGRDLPGVESGGSCQPVLDVYGIAVTGH